MAKNDALLKALDDLATLCKAQVDDSPAKWQLMLKIEEIRAILNVYK